MRRRVMFDVATSGSENVSVSGYNDKPGGKKTIQINIGSYGFMLDGLFWKVFKKGAHNQTEKGGPVRVAVKLDQLDDPDTARPSLHVAVILDGTTVQPLNGDAMVEVETNDGRVVRTIMSPETAGKVIVDGIDEFLTPEILSEVLKENKPVKLVWLNSRISEAVARRVTDVSSVLWSYGIPEVEEDGGQERNCAE